MSVTVTPQVSAQSFGHQIDLLVAAKLGKAKAEDETGLITDTMNRIWFEIVANIEPAVSVDALSAAVHSPRFFPILLILFVIASCLLLQRCNTPRYAPAQYVPPQPRRTFRSIQHEPSRVLVVK